MNILFVCHRLPYPPSRGGKIRPFNIIKHLTASGHRVTVASIARSDAELSEGLGLAEYCADVLVEKVAAMPAAAKMLLRVPTRIPSSMGYFHSGALKSRIRRATEERSYDLTFVHCSSAAQYVENIQLPHKVLDFGDMDSQKWLDYVRHRAFPRSAAYWVEGKKLAATERRLAGLFDQCTCTTRQELETLNELCDHSSTAWFPNGVDHSYFSPSSEPYDRNQICFIGRMDYFPNIQSMLAFCEHAFPLIRRANPKARLVIVGASPARAIRRLDRVDGVTVTGSVKDVRPFVRASALTLAPLMIARGTQNKILESMAMGVPVVASPLAARGVDAVPGEHLLTADCPREVAEAALSLMSDPRRRAALSAAGRARVQSHHDWARSMQKLDGILANMLGRPRST